MYSSRMFRFVRLIGLTGATSPVRLGSVRLLSINSTTAYDEVMKVLRSDLKQSIRMEADPLEKNVIRSILTEVKNMEIATRGELHDEFQLADLLDKMIKERNASAAEYMKEGSPDRFQQVGLNELREADFLTSYLKRLPVASDKEVDEHVTKLAETLKSEGELNSKEDLFKKIPWKTVKGQWHASRSSISKSVERVFKEVSDVEA